MRDVLRRERTNKVQAAAGDRHPAGARRVVRSRRRVPAPLIVGILALAGVGMWLWSATLIAYPESLIGSSTPSIGTPLIKTTTSETLPGQVVPVDVVHPTTDAPYVVEPPPYDRVQIIFTDHRLHAGETWLYDAGALPSQPRQNYPDDHNDPWGVDELISSHCLDRLG